MNNKSTEFLTISTNGLVQALPRSKKAQFPGQHSIWTDDIRVELPIRIGSAQGSNIPPQTLLNNWKINQQRYSSSPALSIKQNNEWKTITYAEYYHESLKFAKSLISLGLQQFSSVALIGFNSPEWMIGFNGTIFARCIPVGVYSTNSKSTCEYIAEHSQTRVVIAQNRNFAHKYYDLLERGIISHIVLYAQQVGEDHRGGKIVNWKTFMDFGSKISMEAVALRQSRIRPGNCCTLIYTSGTTGMPKGAMLSHDNCAWTTIMSGSRPDSFKGQQCRVISYLPLSHAAALFNDIFVSIYKGHHIYFADNKALQGTLITTMKQVRPQAFFSVPRIWQKIYGILKEVQKTKTGIEARVFEWALKVGEQTVILKQNNKPVSWRYNVADKLVFSKVKQALGLEQSRHFGYGSAPLDPEIRRFLTSLGIPLRNGYGLTETSAPQSNTNFDVYRPSKPEDYLEVGHPICGAITKIHKLKQTDEQGEICMFGRNVFMGYFKNAAQTSKTIDQHGCLHSGDLGRINEKGFLYITGRLKELIITAGGENIPPILIENQIKQTLPFLSNVMLVGDNRPFLSCLISLKEDPLQSGIVQKAAAAYLARLSCNITLVKEAKDNPAFQKIITTGLDKANQKAISRAQYVHKFYLMLEDFSVDNGILTPSLKLKRKQALKKYTKQIDQLYNTPKL